MRKLLVMALLLTLVASGSGTFGWRPVERENFALGRRSISLGALRGGVKGRLRPRRCPDWAPDSERICVVEIVSSEGTLEGTISVSLEDSKERRDRGKRCSRSLHGARPGRWRALAGVAGGRG